MTPDGWQIREITKEIFEVIFWEDGERSIEFTITKDQMQDLIENLNGALYDD